MEDKVRAEVLSTAKNGKLPCGQALEMAKKLGCETALIGKVANEEKIKIVACSLGCF